MQWTKDDREYAATLQAHRQRDLRGFIDYATKLSPKTFYYVTSEDVERSARCQNALIAALVCQRAIQTRGLLPDLMQAHQIALKEMHNAVGLPA